MTYLAVVVGLALLYFGGEAMLKGAVATARRFHLSEIFVGVAIVGFATSAPELFVSVDAGLSGRPEIAVGNVVGSNTANLLLILGVGAMIRPIVADREVVSRDASMMVVAMLAACAFVAVGGGGRLAGAVMFLALVAYIVDGFRTARAAGKPPEPPPDADDTQLRSPIWIGLMLAGGVGALAIGAEALLWGAVGIAEAAGLSDRAIGVSLVALGTSLPELATGIVAARRGASDVAIGNVLGSCVFNVFGILGLTALAAPIHLPNGGFLIDIAVMAFAGALILGLGLYRCAIGRRIGFGMTLAYVAYVALLYAGMIG